MPTRKGQPLRWSPAIVQAAADPASERLHAETTALLDRTLAGALAAPRRPPGRGSELSPSWQLAVMVHSAVYGHGPRTIARRLGVNRGTVRRVLATSTYRQFEQYVTKRVLNRIFASRGPRW